MRRHAMLKYGVPDSQGWYVNRGLLLLRLVVKAGNFGHRRLVAIGAQNVIRLCMRRAGVYGRTSVGVMLDRRAHLLRALQDIQ